MGRELLYERGVRVVYVLARFQHVVEIQPRRLLSVPFHQLIHGSSNQGINVGKGCRSNAAEYASSTAIVFGYGDGVSKGMMVRG